MEYKQIQELIKTINKSNISELCIEEGEFRITIKQEFTGQATFASYPQPAMPVNMPAMPAPAPQMSAAPAATAADKTAAPSAAENSNTIVIKSPMIGTFYRSPAPDKPVFVNVGDEIKKGQVLCIIEAMKLFNEIESEVSGRLVKVVADDTTPVEYEQPLFVIEPL